MPMTARTRIRRECRGDLIPKTKLAHRTTERWISRICMKGVAGMFMIFNLEHQATLTRICT